MVRLLGLGVVAVLTALVAACSAPSKTLPIAGGNIFRPTSSRSSAAPYLYVASKGQDVKSRGRGMTAVFQVGQSSALRLATQTVHPVGVAVDHDGNVYVVSEGTLYVYAPGLSSLIRTVPGVYNEGAPVSIAVDAQNNVYVPTQNYQIAEYSEGGATLLRVIQGASPTFFVDRSSHLYVTSNDTIWVYGRTGTSPIRTIGVPNVDAIAVDSMGHIYADVCRGYGIEVFSPTGRFIRGNNQCSTILALDQNDYLYVGYGGPSRNAHGAVVVYKPYSFEQFKEIKEGIHRIRAMIVDAAGNLYVANGRGGTGVGNVVMYPFGKGTPAWTVAGGDRDGITYPEGLALAPASSHSR